MHKTHVYSNPSVQRSLIQPVLVRSEINEYMDLCLEGTNVKKIKIFPNMEYNFSFYDSTYGIKKMVTGLVTNIYSDQIKIKCIDSKKDMVDCSKCHNENCGKAGNHILPPMPICGCILNPPDTSKYDEPKVYFIPIENIMDVSYIQNRTITKPKGGTKVVILGISATILKAIVIRLEFFDDNIDEAVKLVELEKDKIYDLVYDHKGSIYESRAKIINIEECEYDTNENNSNSIVRENIGFNNSIYTSHKDKFMKDEPTVRKIKITVDTSETFNGSLEVIMLDSIRDCTLVEDETLDIAKDDDSITDTEMPNCNCNPTK